MSQSEHPIWKTAYLGLGANLGDKQSNIISALRDLDAPPTITVACVSSLYETLPVGNINQPNFLNGVAEVRTVLTPDDLLIFILALEKKMGRVRTQRWGPRVIDIDILTYANEIRVTPTLVLPHARLLERAFALVPLAEIAPDLVLPGRKESVKIAAEKIRNVGNIISARIVTEFKSGDTCVGQP